MHLKNWKAKRAGGRITVYGKTSDDRDAKIVGVDSIAPCNGQIIAFDKDGDQHVLSAN